MIKKPYLFFLFIIFFMIANLLFSKNNLFIFLKKNKILKNKIKKLEELKIKDLNLKLLIEEFDKENPDLIDELVKQKLNLCNLKEKATKDL